MRSSKIITLIGTFAFIAALIVGCVPSLHPLYTDKDVVFEPKLVGVWAPENSDETWEFSKSGEKAYQLIQTSDGHPGKFEVHLVKLGDFLFLDMYPQEPDIENDFYRAHLIPAHTFARMWLKDDELRLGLMGYEWLKKGIDAKKITIKHERVDDGILLTASTKELQEFVLKYAESDEAFSKSEPLMRKKVSTQE